MTDLREHPRLTAPPVWWLAIAVALFALMAVLATAREVAPGDDPVLDLVQDLPSTPFEVPLDVANVLGHTATGPVTVVILTVLCAWRRFVPGIVFCLTLLLLRLGGMYLKGVFESPRPDTGNAEIRGTYDGLGFPSGHAMTATCIAMAATIILPALFHVGSLVRTVIGTVWIVALMCGIARIWYGAHWPTDVIGGGASAVVMAWIAGWIAASYQSRSRKTAMPPASAATDNHRRTISR